MKKIRLTVFALAIISFLMQMNIAFAGDEPYIGEIKMWPFNFAPKGWALCQGQTLFINEYQALFAILGTTYGGNGSTTFALPNLQGRIPVGVGSSSTAGITVNLGEQAGNEKTTLTTFNLPAHNHTITANIINNGSSITVNTPVSTQPGNTDTPGNTTILANVYDATGGSKIKAYTSEAADANLKPVIVNLPVNVATNVSPTGGGQPFTNMQPYLVVNYIIALQGVFPAQN